MNYIYAAYSIYTVDMKHLQAASTSAVRTAVCPTLLLRA